MVEFSVDNFVNAPTFFDRVNYLRGVHVNVSKPLSYLTLLGDVKTQ